MAENKTVQIAEAKGRPMLHWVGKRPLDHVTAYPAQLVERFDPLQTFEVWETSKVSGDNLLFHGDNKDVLAGLLAHGYRGKVNLVYIDPPFDSGADYVRRIELRGVREAKLEGEAHSLGEQIQYTDIWANDMYLQFMYERLLLLRELLAENGSFYLHCDSTKSHYLKCACDEIFGENSFLCQVVWKRMSSGRKAVANKWHSVDDSLLLYAKSKNVYKPQYLPYSEEYKKRFTHEDEHGRYFWDNIGSYSEARLKQLQALGRVKFSESGALPRGHSLKVG